MHPCRSGLGPGGAGALVHDENATEMFGGNGAGGGQNAAFRAKSDLASASSASDSSLAPATVGKLAAGLPAPAPRKALGMLGGGNGGAAGGCAPSAAAAATPGGAAARRRALGDLTNSGAAPQAVARGAGAGSSVPTSIAGKGQLKQQQQQQQQQQGTAGKPPAAVAAAAPKARPADEAGEKEDAEARMYRLAELYARDGVEGYAGITWQQMDARREREAEREADLGAAAAVRRAFARPLPPAPRPLRVRGAASLVRADDEDDDDDAALVASPVVPRHGLGGRAAGGQADGGARRPPPPPPPPAPRAEAELGAASSPVAAACPAGILLADALNGASLRLLGALGGGIGSTDEEAAAEASRDSENDDGEDEDDGDGGLDALLPDTPRAFGASAGEQHHQPAAPPSRARVLLSPLDAPW